MILFPDGICIFIFSSSVVCFITVYSQEDPNLFQVSFFPQFHQFFAVVFFLSKITSIYVFIWMLYIEMDLIRRICG